MESRLYGFANENDWLQGSGSEESRTSDFRMGLSVASRMFGLAEEYLWLQGVGHARQLGAFPELPRRPPQQPYGHPNGRVFRTREWALGFTLG